MSGEIKRRQFVATTGGILLMTFSIIPWNKAWGVQVIGVRMWPSKEYTRLTIEHDVPMRFKYSVKHDSSPVRMVVDIEGLLLTDTIKQIPQKVDPYDPYVKSIQVSQLNEKFVRLVFMFKTDVDPEILTLKPFAEYKYRLVFDIYPMVQDDPILAILQKQETESESDLIGQLMQEIAEGKKRMAENMAAAKKEEKQDAIESLIAQKAPGQAKPAPKPSTSAKPVPAPVPAKPSSTTKRRTLVIAIDPGHGGEDPGAIGSTYNTREKDVVLSIGRMLARQLNSVPGFRTVMTRDSDYFVPLQRRVAKARAARADFFVSVHADAWIKPDVKGSSIFTLNTKGQVSTANKWLADKQNSADMIGGASISKRDRKVNQLLLDMSFEAQIKDSLSYASRILGEMKKINALHKGNVERANFAVLKAPDIPSVLVETAYLSNPDEERRLRSADFQRKMAAAIGNGILRGFGYPGTLS